MSNPPTRCDFEPLDLCGWSHDPTHDFDWKRNQYATPSGHVGTGPSFDHTFGAGKGGVYLYMETSSPRKPDETARIFSPVYSSDHSGGCFSFWYHMYGENTGGLRVYIKPESQLFGELKPVWELYGEQGNEWFQEKVIVPVTDEEFQIIIEGTRGNGYLGDTAIDDVSLSSSICEDIKFPDNDSVITTDPLSCRGRCKDPPSETGCSCLETCHLDENCCRDYQTFCASTTSTDEIISETTTSTSTASQPSELPFTLQSSITPSEFSITVQNVTSTSELSSMPLSSSTESIIPVSMTLASTTTFTSSQKPSTTTTTTTSTTTTTTLKPTTTTTTTPKPTTTTPKPTTTTTTTTTTPKPTTTTPKPTTTTTSTTTTTPKPTTSTTTSTSKSTYPPPPPTTTTSTPKSTYYPPPPPTTTTTPQPRTTTTTTKEPTTTTSTSLRPTLFTIQYRTNPFYRPTEFVQRMTPTYEPETRRTYNLRPRNRTTLTTPMTIPRTTTKPTTTKRTTEPESTSPPAPSTTTTQRSKFKLTTDDTSAFKDARPSKEASSNSQPTTAIVIVSIFVMAALATASVFLFRKWKAHKLSKTADDSELRFLSENEVVEFSDVCSNDRHNIQQPMIG